MRVKQPFIIGKTDEAVVLLYSEYCTVLYRYEGRPMNVAFQSNLNNVNPIVTCHSTVRVPELLYVFISVQFAARRRLFF